MKRITALIILSLFLVLPMLIAGMAGTALAADRNYITGEDPSAGAEVLDGWPEALDPVQLGEPLDWIYLGTIGGVAGLTLLIVQYTKIPLDRVWKIPTKLLVYVLCLAIMLVATALTDGLTMDNTGLVFVNALLAAITAYGAYEVTFKHLDAKKAVPPDSDPAPDA